MKDLKLLIVLHIILGPPGIWIMVNDWQHPETWGDWYRNPAYAIPWCAAWECLIWSIVLCNWHRERRMGHGISLLNEANRLLAEGNIEAADAAYEKGKRLCGLE